jgi:signal transduction histidine kinase
VTAEVHAGAMHIEVGDDVGGAQAGAGSGLIGLFDRVEARGDQLQIISPPGEGTTIRAALRVGKPVRVRRRT